MESLSVGGEVGGAGGAYSYDALKRLDNLWSNICSVETVTMQAQSVGPSDFICKDKFLIQSTIVPMGTKEEHLTSTTFSKEYGKYVEETRLKVVLISPPTSPVLSPMNEISRVKTYNSATESKDDFVQKFSSLVKVNGEIDVFKRDGEVAEKSVTRKHTQELRLSNDVEEMKSKLRELESLLTQEKQRSNENTSIKAQIGFLFIFVVAIASIYLGYLLLNC